MSDDYLVLSPFENMPADVAKAAAKAAADVKSGKIKIFTGPIKDNAGKTRVPAGKTLPCACQEYPLSKPPYSAATAAELATASFAGLRFTVIQRL